MIIIAVINIWVIRLMMIDSFYPVSIIMFLCLLIYK